MDPSRPPPAPPPDVPGHRPRAGRGGAGFVAPSRAGLRRPGLGHTVGGVVSNSPLHAAKAKRIIYLYMAGGPSHLETLDSKPEAGRDARPAHAGGFTRGMPIAQLQGQKLLCFAPQHPFRHSGSGQEICALFPHIGGVADEICIVRSMVTEAINHDPAHMFMNTGSQDRGPAEHGRLGHLRARQRGRGLARVRRADVAGQGGPEPADRRAAVEQRVPAEPPPGGRSSAPRGTRSCI